MFRASLCPSSGEKTKCYCIWSVFAGSVGCGMLRYCGATLRDHCDTVSTCFGHLYAHLQEKDTCYCMWNVFSGCAGCGSLGYCGAMLRV